MKKVKISPQRLENNLKTKEYLESLPRYYLKACWAKCVLLGYPFSGYYQDIDGRPVPLIWQYDDHNGTDDAYFLRPITFATTGIKYGWTTDAEEGLKWLEEKRQQGL